MRQVSLEQADAIIVGAFARAAEMRLKPLTVAVLDPGGHLVALRRQDCASTLRPQLAIGKAGGALALGLSSRRIEEMAAERPIFITSLGSIASTGIVPAAGGVIIVDEDGVPLGAVGITGDTSDNDEACAIAGITAARMMAQP